MLSTGQAKTHSVESRRTTLLASRHLVIEKRRPTDTAIVRRRRIVVEATRSHQHPTPPESVRTRRGSRPHQTQTAASHRLLVVAASFRER